MVDSIRFDDDAIRELHRAKCFFDSIEKGIEFLNDFENQIELIKTMPFAFQIRYKNVRIVNFEHFSYTIHYMVIFDTVIILNILSQFQDY